MRAARNFAYRLIDRIIPNGLSLYALGLGLPAAGLGQALITLGFADALNILLIPLAGLANIALAAVAIVTALAARMRGDRPPIMAFRFVHFAVAAHAALVLAFLLPTLRTWLNGPDEGALIYLSLPFIWTSLAGAALVLALLNRLRWDARFALVGAAASIAAFGCAVGFAPTIYGWDLRPLGWYAILVSFIPVLAFLAVFLRRAPVFSERRPLRYGLAAALFAALVGAVWFQMSSNPAYEFSERLLTALGDRPSQIGFSEVTDFEWDAVEIYGAYTYAKQISPAVRDGSDIISLSHFGLTDRFKFVAFLRGGEVVYYEAGWAGGYSLSFPRGFGNPAVLKPEEAVFEAEYAPDGYPSLTLKD